MSLIVLPRNNGKLIKYRVYGPEILPLEVRSRGTSISVSSHWTWNFFVVMITPVLINRIQWKTFLVWMALAFSFVPVIYFFYPETSNISLEGELAPVRLR